MFYCDRLCLSIICILIISFEPMALSAQTIATSDQRPSIKNTLTMGSIGINTTAAIGLLTLSIWGKDLIGSNTPSMGHPAEGSTDLRFSYYASPDFNPNRQWLGAIPDYLGYIAPLAGGAYYLGGGLFDKEWDKGRAHEAYAFAQSLLWTQLVTITLKHLVGRERPFVIRAQRDAFDIDDITMKKSERILSFPSGHSSIMAATSFFIAADISDHLIKETLRESGTATQVIMGRILPYTVATLSTWFVLYSRVKDQRHWLSDTLTGGAIGAMIALFSYHSRFDAFGDPYQGRSLDR